MLDPMVLSKSSGIDRGSGRYRFAASVACGDIQSQVRELSHVSRDAPADEPLVVSLGTEDAKLEAASRGANGNRDPKVILAHASRTYPWHAMSP